MFESLFGAGTPLAVRFFIAFLVVFILIGLTAWLVRRFGTGRLGAQSARGRQPRLAVIDAAPVDGRRRLVLIRRDNIEHLLMIGGPSDVVVETNIVRASAANRDTVSARATATVTPTIAATAAAPAPTATPETLPRAVPPGEGALWPLQPEPLPRTQRRAIAEETVHWPLPAEPGPRSRDADPLSGLAAELARPAPKTGSASINGGGRMPPLAEPELAAVEPPHEATAIEEEISAPPEAPSSADQNLAEMAQRLEAALRRPAPPIEPRSSARPVPPRSESAAPTGREGNGAARPTHRNEPKAESGKAQSKPDAANSSFPNLEQEMATLLGRPPGKT